MISGDAAVENIATRRSFGMRTEPAANATPKPSSPYPKAALTSSDCDCTGSVCTYIRGCCAVRYRSSDP